MALAASPSVEKESLPPADPASEADVVDVPSYSRWFCYKTIDECEVRLAPEFFEKRSPSKNPSVYMYYRNSMVKQFRKSGKTLSFTEVRKTLVGDVGSIRRVFDFLEAWGLINYSPPSSSSALNNSSGKPFKLDPQKEAIKSNEPHSPSSALNKRRTCGGCKSACSIACFSCDKYDLTLCARCYVRGNYRTGVSSSDFKRIEISEDTSRDWTAKETLQLLEAITHYCDDWKKVAQHVTGRSEKECITQFIKLPSGEEFSGYTELGEPDSKYNQINYGDAINGPESGSPSSPNKRLRLTPLADASNPIIAQAAFLSALAGVEVAEAAARAAVTTLTDVEYGSSQAILRSLPRNAKQQDGNAVSNGDSNLNALETACLEANSLLEQEEMDMERSISRIAEVQMREIQKKIVHFEKLDLQMEKEWQQFEQLKNLLFADQLTLLFNRSSAAKAVEPKDEIVRTD